MADAIDYKIYGDDMQIVEIELDPGEGVRAEAGAMMYMVDDIEMQTSTGGGLFKGFKRMITGESFFITTFLHNGEGKGHVAFGWINWGGAFCVRRMLFSVRPKESRLK